MASYAIVNEDNVVVNVIKISDEDIEDTNGNEIPEKVIDMKNQILGIESTQRLIKTSYNNNLKGLYAAVGYSYNDNLSMFIQPKDIDYFVFDKETGTWIPPEPQPDRTEYQINNNIIYKWVDDKYQSGENPWELDYSGDNFPQLTPDEFDNGCSYRWDYTKYNEGDVNSGFVLICPELPSIQIQEINSEIGISTT